MQQQLDQVISQKHAHSFISTCINAIILLFRASAPALENYGVCQPPGNKTYILTAKCVRSFVHDTVALRILKFNINSCNDSDDICICLFEGGTYI